MGRRVVRQVNEPKRRGRLGGLLIAGIGIVLLFAAVGIVSAGSYVADRVSSNASQTKPKPGPSGRNVLAMQAIARAHAQATAIVKSAQARQRSIVSAATRRASRQAHSIVSAARRRAASVKRTARRVAAAPGPAATQQSGITQASPSSGLATGSASLNTGAAGYTAGAGANTGTGYSGGTGTTTGTGYTTAPQQSIYGSASPSTPDLSGVPASWRVVAYNATFGSGPGSAGSITVTNRSAKIFSGVAKVVYTNGGTALARFSGLSPGQTLTLPLNGQSYSGGGYRIIVVDVR